MARAYTKHAEPCFKRTTQTVGPQVGTKASADLMRVPEDGRFLSHLARFFFGSYEKSTYREALPSTKLDARPLHHHLEQFSRLLWVSPRAAGSANCSTCALVQQAMPQVIPIVVPTRSTYSTEQHTATPGSTRGTIFASIRGRGASIAACILLRPLPPTSHHTHPSPHAGQRRPSKCCHAGHAAHWPCAAIPPCLALGIRQAALSGPMPKSPVHAPCFFFSLLFPLLS